MKKITIRTLLAFVLALTFFLSAPLTANAAYLGIDVSKHNGSINWNAVKSSGVSYAFIKVGSTNSGMDPYFPANVQGAQAAGIRTGVYIYSYANNVAEAVNEANQVLAWIEPYNINFPISYDIENSNHQKLDAATVTAMCNAFCDVIYSAGYTPIIYTYANFYKTHIISSELRYDKWIAQYGNNCDIPGYVIWQYSSTGAVSGMNGNVDLDAMVVDYHSAIPQSAFVTASNGNVYFYNNYRKTRGWVEVNGARYHMGDNFAMNTGWLSDTTGLYYLSDTNGQALVGMNQVGGKTYYFNETGALQTGILNINNQLYYFDPNNNGSMASGWVQTSGGGKYYFTQQGPALIGMNQVGNDWYYFGNDGITATGFINVGGTVYFFDPSTGVRLSGFQTINGQTYYFDPNNNGAMVTGWFTTNNYANSTTKPVYYFADANGVVLSGLQTINGNTYLLTPAMARGLQSVNGRAVYFDDDNGAMKRNVWFTVENPNSDTDRYYKYFADSNGYLATGLTQIGDKYYYFDETGKIKGGIINFNGTLRYFDEDTGELRFGWIDEPIKNAREQYVKDANGNIVLDESNVRTLYGLSDGTLAVNTALVIEGDLYVFNSKGYKVRNQEIKIGTKKYTCDNNGVATEIR